MWERGSSVAAAHKEVEAEKCHSARWVTSTRRPRGDEVSQSQGRGLASSPQPWARHHQSHWHPLTFLCICFNVPLPPSIPPPPQEDLFTSMAYASPSSACLSLSPSTHFGVGTHQAWNVLYVMMLKAFSFFLSPYMLLNRDTAKKKKEGTCSGSLKVCPLVLGKKKKDGEDNSLVLIMYYSTVFLVQAQCVSHTFDRHC